MFEYKFKKGDRVRWNGVGHDCAILKTDDICIIDESNSISPHYHTEAKDAGGHFKHVCWTHQEHFDLAEAADTDDSCIEELYSSDVARQSVSCPFEIGDIVTGVATSHYSRTTPECTMRVISRSDASLGIDDMRVKILDGPYKGGDYSVSSKYFKLADHYKVHKTIKEEPTVSVVSKLRDLALSPGDRLIKKYSLKDECGQLTGYGQEVLLDILFEANKDKIVAKLTELKKAEDADKKK